MKRGNIFIISAPSGSGKTTIANHLFSDKSLSLIKSISLTTRPIRPSDIRGHEYKFVTRKDFLKKLKRGYFLEYANVFGNLYGTPKRNVLDAIEKGKDILLSIDVQGGMQVKKIYKKETILIFISSPSMDELKKRLHSRQSEDSREIRKRLDIARQELRYVDRYDYLIINDNLKRAVEKIKNIIMAARCRVEMINHKINLGGN